jgi:ribosomal protein S18 acetylase RimI-like enzyme
VATVADVGVIGQLLHDFNVEYAEPTPSPAQIAARLVTLLDHGDTTVVLTGDGPDGLAVLRLRPNLWSDALECYLAELYVRPALRGQGIGRELLTYVLDVARHLGADRIDLGTSEDDVAARGLYASMGFVRRERPPDGPIMYIYERDL